jgi:hypothetical protein
MIRQFVAGCLIFLFLHTGSPITAQVVNIESARMRSDTVGWTGKLGAAFALTQNTRKIFQAHLGAHLQYKTSSDKGLWLILGNFGLLKSSKDKLVSENLFHLRYNRKVNEWLRWEFFGQHQNNAITQIDSRILAGTGPRFKILKKEKFRMYAATLVMYEKEKERTDPVVKHQDIRSSSYLSFSWEPQSNMALVSTTYFQPLFNKLSDHRILNTLTFTIDASRHFGMSVSWNYLFDRFPAGTAPKTNYNFSTGLTYEL